MWRAVFGIATTPCGRGTIVPGPLLAWVYAGEVIAHHVLVALGDVIVVEGFAGLLLVLAVDLRVGHLRRVGGVGVGVRACAALLAAGAVLPLHGYRGARGVDAARRSVHRVAVPRSPA